MPPAREEVPEPKNETSPHANWLRALLLYDLGSDQSRWAMSPIWSIHLPDTLILESSGIPVQHLSGSFRPEQWGAD